MKLKLILILFVLLANLNLLAQNRCTSDSSLIRRYINEDKLDSAVHVFSEKTLEYELCSIVYSMLIYSYLVKGDYTNGLVFADKWLHISMAKGDTTTIIGANNYKVKALYELGNIQKAIQISSNQRNYFREKDSIKNMENDLRLGLLLRETKQYERAYSVYKNINFGLVKKKGAEETYYNNFASIYADLGRFDSALVYYKNSLQKTKMNEDPQSSLLAYANITATYIDLGKYNLALEYIDSTQLIKTVSKFNPVYRFVYTNYYTVYKVLNNLDSAWVYIDRLKVLNDSIFNSRLQTEIKEVQLSNKREVKLIKREKTTDSYLQNTENKLLIIIILFLLVAIASVFFIFHLKVKDIKSMNKNILMQQKLLRSQMTPHFIFNSLSIIQGMILSDEKKTAVNYLSKFSKLMRLILENSRNKNVKLVQEIKALEYYLELQNLRMNKSLDWSIVYKNDFVKENIVIPPMLIQPFVENSLKHGFLPSQKDCELRIELSKESDFLHIVIIDNGIGINSAPNSTKGTSLSTKITIERLLLLPKKDRKKSYFEITDRSKFNERGTIVNLTILLNPNL